MDQDLEVRTYSPAHSLGHARRRAAIMLLVATAFAAVIGALMFFAILHGDWMTSGFGRIAELMFKQPVWAILAATSPLACALLVGYGYMQRAIRKRGAEREAALQAATTRGQA
jgi:hypothetical protein